MLENISLWFSTVMLEENGGHGGSRCRWSEKHLVKNFVCDRKFFSLPSEKIAKNKEKFVCDRGLLRNKSSLSEHVSKRLLAAKALQKLPRATTRRRLAIALIGMLCNSSIVGSL